MNKKKHYKQQYKLYPEMPSLILTVSVCTIEEKILGLSLVRGILFHAIISFKTLKFSFNFIEYIDLSVFV